MRKLTRPQKPPRCIERAQNTGATNWQRLRGRDRREIWIKLNEMQHRICAYCESAFSEGDSHIEHLYPRAKYEGLTFEWKNLFGSCNSQNSCGIYKDSARNPTATTHELLIKPDHDDPHRYFQYYKNGRIAGKPVLPEKMYQQAKETMRAFNLNNSALVSLRRSHLEPLMQLEEEFILWCDLCEDDPDMLYDLEREIRSLLEEQIDTAYQSIKQHYIRKHLDLLGLIDEGEEIFKPKPPAPKRKKRKPRKKRRNRSYRASQNRRSNTNSQRQNNSQNSQRRKKRKSKKSNSQQTKSKQ